MNGSLSRREFTRALAAGSAAFAATVVDAERALAAPAWRLRTGALDWAAIRERFLIAEGLAPMNAANLCPSSTDVLSTLYEHTRSVDRDPSPQNRARFGEAKESLRRSVAAFLNVTPEEILLTRNTSEANNHVSAGLELKSGDEVVIFSDNHPSNHQAWRERAKRFGFTVKIVEQFNPHPGAEFYLDAFRRALSTNTRVLGFTHMTNTVGDVFPAAEICRAAREHGVLTLLDGAQSFGLMAVDLQAIQPDFYSGSAHKWPCGAREVGVLYVRRDVQPRFWPSVYSAYTGGIGLSRTHEGFGQRDDAVFLAFERALALQQEIGRAAIEQRSRMLAQSLMEGLSKLPGVKLWTSRDAARSAAVVSFQPGTLDVRRLAQALYQRDRIAVATRGGNDRPGVRLSPHFYNLEEEMERMVAALRGYLRNGV
ncbi:MAG: aminotransferase class V-fold PLP-dependent enzyme [Longimicrobiales bacterium]